MSVVSQTGRRTRLFRRVIWVGLGLLVVLPAVQMMGSAQASAQDDPDAQALLQQAATAMAGVQSFQFTLSSEKGKTVILDQLELGDVSGAVQRPDRFRATARADVAGLASLNVEVIGIGTRIWVTNPLGEAGGGGKYIELDLGSAEEAQTIVELLNPDQLLLRAIDVLQEPEIRGEDEIDGVNATVIEGTFDPSNALDILAGTPTATEVSSETGVNFAGPVPVLVWIDESGLVRRVRIEGPLIEGEATDVVRRLDVTAYNEPVDIQPPT